MCVQAMNERIVLQ